jgi:hypothetical protein
MAEANDKQASEMNGRIVSDAQASDWAEHNWRDLPVHFGSGGLSEYMPSPQNSASDRHDHRMRNAHVSFEARLWSEDRTFVL